jgi:nuclear transport factor 2 (NTF2) superfamily protein
MDDDVKLLERLYDRFNARDIDSVLTALADDVAWANGMDGGHVHGREAVRAYWTRQWAWSVRTSSLWAFIELRMARSSRKSGSPSAISKANRLRGRRTG